MNWSELGAALLAVVAVAFTVTGPIVYLMSLRTKDPS